MKFEVAILLALGIALLVRRVKASRPSAVSIRLLVGQSAPAFVLQDQFGREQSNETLRGRHGTVILFFRSVDW